MTTGPIYWTFSKATGEATKVGQVAWNGLRSFAEDSKGELWQARRLFTSEAEALAAAGKYLDGKQRIINEAQAKIDRRRAFIKQQLRNTA